ncbi:MAG: ribonuclease HII [Candidatus Coatesbacteria bacterium]|nr:ribonuclease HII [Candidatus Coatesbacteria bacterium]
MSREIAAVTFLSNTANSESTGAMWAFDERVRAEGYEFVAGVDEVGRGCLAGPVVAAAVILPREFRDDRIRDSKQLTANAREELFGIITDRALSYGVGIIPPKTIDAINILQAALLAMAKAIRELRQTPDIMLVDGNRKIPDHIRQVTVVKGDSKSLSIAAASIVAKVWRDRLMCEFDSQYPHYGFAGNKGYGSKAHVDSLRLHGPCAIHRESFSPVRRAIESSAGEKQGDCGSYHNRTLDLAF